MSVQRSNFPQTVWDGTAASLKNPLDDKTDYQISDRHAAEIVAIEAYLKAYVELLRFIGNPNTVIGVNNLGTALEYKRFVAGSNVIITHTPGAITFAASGGGGSGDTPYSGEADSDIVVGQPVYVKSNTHIDLAKADNAATMQVAGLANADAAATTAGTYLSDGRIILADWTAIIGALELSPGAIYYLDAAIAGMLTTTPPDSGFIIIVGRAIDSATFDIEISNPIKL